MKETISLSVIIPVYNGEEFLAEAVQSVMSQAFLPAELIIVDDGSTDGSAEVIRRLENTVTTPVRTITQSNLGPSAARNRGLEVSNGDLIAFLDCDDLWDQDKLAVQVSLLNQRHEISVVWGLTQIFQIQDSVRSKVRDAFHSTQLGSFLCRRSLFDAIGIFDESMRFSEDLDWFLRLREMNQPYLAHTQTALWYRYHGNNTWLGTQGGEVKMVMALRKRLERKRAEQKAASNSGSGKAEIG